MSRIGKLPIVIPGNIEIKISDSTVTVKGSKGELSVVLHPLVKITQIENTLVVERVNDTQEARAIHGLSRTLVSNMVEGLTQGFQKKLEINGVGYRAAIQGEKVVLSLGFSHPVEYLIPEGIDIVIDAEKKNLLIVSGIDKQKVGQVAAEIRSLKKPEPYKGKGIKYLEERIVRKAGKTAAK